MQRFLQVFISRVTTTFCLKHFPILDPALSRLNFTFRLNVYLKLCYIRRLPVSRRSVRSDVTAHNLTPVKRARPGQNTPSITVIKYLGYVSRQSRVCCDSLLSNNTF